MRDREGESRGREKRREMGASEKGLRGKEGGEGGRVREIGDRKREMGGRDGGWRGREESREVWK